MPSLVHFPLAVGSPHHHTQYYKNSHPHNYPKCDTSMEAPLLSSYPMLEHMWSCLAQPSTDWTRRYCGESCGICTLRWTAPSEAVLTGIEWSEAISLCSKSSDLSVYRNHRRNSQNRTHQIWQFPKRHWCLTWSCSTSFAAGSDWLLELPTTWHPSAGPCRWTHIPVCCWMAGWLGRRKQHPRRTRSSHEAANPADAHRGRPRPPPQHYSHSIQHCPLSQCWSLPWVSLSCHRRLSSQQSSTHHCRLSQASYQWTCPLCSMATPLYNSHAWLGCYQDYQTEFHGCPSWRLEAQCTGS